MQRKKVRTDFKNDGREKKSTIKDAVLEGKTKEEQLVKREKKEEHKR